MPVYYLIRFTEKTGEIDTTLSAGSKALLKMWGLQNTPFGKDTIIFDEAGNVIMYYEGAKDFPNVLPYTGHIDDFCKGLLEEVRKE